MSSKEVEVWLDSDLTRVPVLVGALRSDNGQTPFDYAATWLESTASFPIDPDFTLIYNSFFPAPDTENFGAFSTDVGTAGASLPAW